MERRVGLVKGINKEKGFAFIYEPSTKGQAFLHVSKLLYPDFKYLKDGDRVSYILVEVARGREAIDVRVIEEDL